MIDTIAIRPLPRLHALPATLPLDGAVRIELEEGVPILKASNPIQARIEKLILKEHGEELTAKEKAELDYYEEIDDYLSLINRVTRNLIQHQPGQEA